MLYFLQQVVELYKNLRTKWKHRVLFFLILSLGIFARTWEFNRLPPGLNADEASIGVEAFSLYHYGVDRNGISYPVHFISWGNGQNLLYGYLIIPFIAFFNKLNPTVVRLPMLISGILSLPLMYFIGKKTFNERLGLLSMFLLAISPWHILLSRWGLECNIFPFFFLTGYACLLLIKRESKWFLAACIYFGLCLYAYGTAYVMIPFFLLCASIILARMKVLSFRDQFVGILIIIIITLPICIFVAVNTFNLNSIKLGPITIPRFPIRSRFGPIYDGINLQNIAINIWIAIKLLFTQSDGLIYNAFDPFGYFYKITFPFALIGIAIIARTKSNQNSMERMFLLSWICGAALIGIVQSVNINKFNIIFIPLLMCTAISIEWLNNRYKYLSFITICTLLMGFVLFTIAYHGSSYRDQANFKFHTGLLPAIEFARRITEGPICITDKITMPYIFILFSEQTNPANYLANIEYQDPHAPLRQVISMERYTFGIQNCQISPATTYLLFGDENPPHLGNKYKVEFFNDFKVLYASR